MEKTPKMRSSIACARCRKSKVKCINNGVNTSCRACEAAGRECTYPPPASGSTGTTQSHVEAPPRKKKSNGPSHSSRPVADALDPNILTPAVWSGVYDLLTLHYPHLPILHRPTFLRPLTEPLSATPSSTSSTPPPLPSPFLLLAVLCLAGRFSSVLIAHHNTSPANTSEFYASALRARFLSISSHDSEDDGILTPSIAKIQSLIMLAVHELGQSHGDRAWIWLGIAVRMCQLLDLPPTIPSSSSSSSQAIIESESERRTWWAVVMLDRMLSSSGSGKGRAFAYGWERVKGVPLPCSERAWLFGDRVNVGSLDEPITKTNEVVQKNGILGRNEDLPDESGPEESVHARLIRLVDIWGRVCQFLCNPETSNSTHTTLSSELERWREDLPRPLSYSLQNLSAHISAHTSSSYALLHILYYLSILLLHREQLPVVPPAIGVDPVNRCFSAARKITEIAREMHTWLSLPLTPIVCFAVYCTAWVGIYGLHHPQMKVPAGNGMGTGDSKFLLGIIEGWKSKWGAADGWLRLLGAEHAFLGHRKVGDIHRKRSYDEMDVSPGPENEELRDLDNTLKDMLGRKERPAKKPRSNVSGSDTEMASPKQDDKWVAVNTTRHEPLQGLLAAALTPSEGSAPATEHSITADLSQPPTAAAAAADRLEASEASTAEQPERKYYFEGWGRRGIAKVDLAGFAEGKIWEDWGEDECWFSRDIARNIFA